MSPIVLRRLDLECAGLGCGRADNPISIKSHEVGAAHDGHQFRAECRDLQANSAVTGAKDERCCGINAPGGRIRMATSDGQLVVLGGWI